MTDWEDYYEILGVSPDSGDKEIKDAYLYKVNILHPDRLSGASESVRRRAEEDLKQVNRAYEVLSAPQKRKQYYSEWIKHKAGTKRIPKPIPVVDPTVISFSDVEPGETKKATFIVKNSGGPYSEIRIHPSNPYSWVKIIDRWSLGTSDELPLQVEIEAEADEWNKSYSEYIEVKLDEEETAVKVDLQTKAQPATGVVSSRRGVAKTRPVKGRNLAGLIGVALLGALAGALIGGLVFMPVGCMIGVLAGNQNVGLDVGAWVGVILGLGLGAYFSIKKSRE